MRSREELSAEERMQLDADIRRYEQDCQKGCKKWKNNTLIAFIILFFISLIASFLVPEPIKPIPICFVAGLVVTFPVLLHLINF